MNVRVSQTKSKYSHPDILDGNYGEVGDKVSQALNQDPTDDKGSPEPLVRIDLRVKVGTGLIGRAHDSEL